MSPAHSLTLCGRGGYVREMLSGATAVVRGALAAGCDFFAGYPITPATPILLQMLQALPRVGGIAIQGEDEVASIGMCIGAAAAGRRALTATSGPGLSLYSENIGLAQMAELPLVIVDVQRLGPATGGATIVGQGDVLFARWGTAGGFPMIVLAPSTIPECATLTLEAFQLAEHFRCPVVLLSDKELNLTLATVEMPDLAGLAREGLSPAAFSKGAIADRATDQMWGAPGRTFGTGEVVRYTGSTHDADQMMTKDATAIRQLNERLVTKIEEHRDELERGRCDIVSGASTLLVSYGVSAGAIESAAALARALGRCVSTAVVQSLWPVPRRLLRAAAEGVSRIVVGELNPGLYARELRCLFPDREVVSITRMDGQLLTPEMVLAWCL